MAETAQFCKIMNYKLNELKDAHPEDRALIEAFQAQMNDKAEVISPTTRRALLKFPMQFVQPIRTSDGEWTTQLHIWADVQLKELLMIDPIVLTAKDSNDDSVLKRLIMAALGKFTQTVNYDLLEKLFKKDMKYNAVVVPGDKEHTEPGNAWYEQDLEGNTVAEYLFNYASGEGEFSGQPQDERILGLFDLYAHDALKLEGVDDPIDHIGEKKSKKKKEEEETEKTPEAEPGESVNTDQSTEKLDDDGDPEETVELDEDGNYRPKDHDGTGNQEAVAQNLLKVIMKLGSMLN